MIMAGHPGAAAECRGQAHKFKEAKMAPFAGLYEGMACLAEGDVRPLRSAVDALLAGGLRDPEGFFVMGLALAGGGDLDRALELIREAIGRGYFPLATLDTHPWLDRLRGRAPFVEVLERARRLHADARQAFLEAGGAAL